jgi:hypothetical protein
MYMAKPVRIRRRQQIGIVAYTMLKLPLLLLLVLPLLLGALVAAIEHYGEQKKQQSTDDECVPGRS